MRIDIDLRGVPEVVQLLERYPDRLQKLILVNALQKATVPILAQAKLNLATQVRVTGVKTDPIREGLRIGKGRRRRLKGVVRAQILTPSRAKLGIGKNAKWYYPAHIELGTQDTPAKPYMRPALMTKSQEAIAIIQREVRSSLEELS